MDKNHVPCPECGGKTKKLSLFGKIIYQCEEGHKTEVTLEETKPSDENLLEEHGN
jgi:lysyl-tRNA synthetase class I